MCPCMIDFCLDPCSIYETGEWQAGPQLQGWWIIHAWTIRTLCHGDRHHIQARPMGLDLSSLRWVGRRISPSPVLCWVGRKLMCDAATLSPTQYENGANTQEGSGGKWNDASGCSSVLAPLSFQGRATDFLCKGPTSKSSRLCGPWSLCSDSSFLNSVILAWKQHSV